MSIRRLFASLILALGLIFGFLWLFGKTTVSAATLAEDEIAVPTGSHFPMDGFTRYVAITGTDSGACNTPASACRTIQYAVYQATIGDEILVASGTYTGVQTRNEVPQIAYISETVTIRGGYNTNNGFAGPSDPISNPTILDAEEQGRALYITDNANVTIEGLQITGGKAYGLGGDYWNGGGNGGGIFVITATATLSNIRMSDNSAYYRGGGVYAAGDLVFMNTDLLSNTSEWFGGGAYVGGHAVLSGGRVENNSCVFNDGGGLYAGSLTLTGTKFVNNFCENGGGASVHGNASLANGQFEHNQCFDTICKGGGIYVGGIVTMSALNFIDNTAGAYGGGAYVDGVLAVSDAGFHSNTAQFRGGGAYVVGKLILTNTEFLNNTATGGAGLYVADIGWNSRLTNGVFVHNNAAFGGGIWIGLGTVDVFNTTITQDPVRYGSGIYVEQGITHIINTIIASHTTGIEQSGSSTVYENYNLFYPTTIVSGSGIINHGSYNSFVGHPSFASDGYHLTSSSAAINRGLNIDIGTDIDGEPRPDDCVFDIGADEFMTGFTCNNHVYLPILTRSF